MAAAVCIPALLRVKQKYGKPRRQIEGLPPWGTARVPLLESECLTKAHHGKSKAAMKSTTAVTGCGRKVIDDVAGGCGRRLGLRYGPVCTKYRWATQEPEGRLGQESEMPSWSQQSDLTPVYSGGGGRTCTPSKRNCRHRLQNSLHINIYCCPA